MASVGPPVMKPMMLTSWFLTLFPLTSNNSLGCWPVPVGTKLATMACDPAQPRTAAVAGSVCGQSQSILGGGHDKPGRDMAIMIPLHTENPIGLLSILCSYYSHSSTFFLVKRVYLNFKTNND